MVWFVPPAIGHTCGTGGMWSRSRRGSTLFSVHLFTSVRFHFIHVLLARDDADGFCCMSSRNVWQGAQVEGSYRRSDVMHVAHSGQGCHISRAVCSGGIPAGMRTLEFSVGTIILERDKRMSVNNKNRSRGGAYQVISRQWSFGSMFMCPFQSFSP